MILYCVRHGETTFNAEGRIQGHSNLPGLSELGRRQGEAAAEALAAYPIEAVYASPLRRAAETAAPIHARLGLEVRYDDRLREIDVGRFQEQRKRDLLEQFPDEMARWNSGDPDYALPGGESRRQLAARGCEAFLEIAASNAGHVAIVSHGGILVVTIKSLLGIPLGEPPLALENGSISRLAIHADGRIELLGFNDVTHLRDVGLAGIGDLAV